MSTRRYPIDGLWLTESELARYFLGQLDAESHMRLRPSTDMEPIRPPSEGDFERPGVQRQSKAQRAATGRIQGVRAASDGLPL